MGLASGLVVFIVSLTGAILVFEHEVMKMTDAPFVHINPQRAIDPEPSSYLHPSVLIKQFDEKFPGALKWGISYHRGFSSTVWGYDTVNNKDVELMVHPQNGKEAPLRTDVERPG